MAFTTTTGAGGTSLLGTSGVDTTTFTPSTITSAVFIGGKGDGDFITLQTNQANGYSVFGGTGTDTITAAGFKNSLVSADEDNDTITSTGTIEKSTVSGLNGNDTITVVNINGSIVNGNNGNDTLNVSGAFTNNGKFVGGAGNDTLNINAGTTLTSGLVNGQDGDDTIAVTAIGAAMVFGGGATIFGGQGSDTINGAAATNNLVMSGDLGADNLVGSGANDTIFGGDGNDRLTGGFFADSLVGGTGVDTFVQTGAASRAATAATASVSYTFANGIDQVVDFLAGSNGDIMSMGGGSIAPTVVPSTANFATTTLGLNIVGAVSGNFVSGVFTVAAGNTGSDTLLITGDGATDLNALLQTAANQVVLKGINVTTLTNSNFV